MRLAVDFMFDTNGIPLNANLSNFPKAGLDAMTAANAIRPPRWAMCQARYQLLQGKFTKDQWFHVRPGRTVVDPYSLASGGDAWDEDYSKWEANLHDNVVMSSSALGQTIAEMAWLSEYLGNRETPPLWLSELAVPIWLT